MHRVLDAGGVDCYVCRTKGCVATHRRLSGCSRHSYWKCLPKAFRQLTVHMGHRTVLRVAELSGRRWHRPRHLIRFRWFANFKEMSDFKSPNGWERRRLFPAKSSRPRYALRCCPRTKGLQIVSVPLVSLGELVSPYHTVHN